MVQWSTSAPSRAAVQSNSTFHCLLIVYSGSFSVWKRDISEGTFTFLINCLLGMFTPNIKHNISTSRNYIHIFLFVLVAPPLLIASFAFRFLQGEGPGFTFQPQHATCHSTEHTHTHPLAWCEKHVTSVLFLVGSSCPRPHPHGFWAPGREEERPCDKETR